MQIAGYTELVRLHDGGQAVVHRATRSADGRPVVLKMLRGPYPSPAERARFRNEYELTARLAGSGVVGVEAWTEVDGLPMIVLEDFGAESLEKLWADGPPPPAEGLTVAIAIVEALRRVHAEPVLHLDINPSNIIQNRQTGEVKLIDFGLSTDLPQQSASLSAEEVLRGTLAFAAPEQTGRMNRSVDYRSDFYSLGATLYWLFAGHPPFQSDDPLELVHAHMARRPRPIEGLQQLSDVVLKLLEKNAEDRYQSLHGLLADLHRCEDYVRHGPFEVGRDDIPLRFTIPERLYGREAELSTLRRAFERVSQGAREVVFVTGHSGMGKTSLVEEARRLVEERRGVYVAGKFEQFKRGVPYASLTAALRRFVRLILTGRQGAVDEWRTRIATAAGPNGRLLTDLIPDLEVLLGEQPGVPDLPPLEAEGRLHRTVRLFVRVLATGQHPLALFMDDLQWADLPSIALLRVLATDTGSGHVLLMGAYRDNEVGAEHPLRGFLQELEAAQVPISTVNVGTLHRSDVETLISETLHAPVSVVSDLAQCCLEKTAGNPFFLHRFLRALARSEHLRFDADAHAWTWDMEQIRAVDVTDNVVTFLARRLGTLPEKTQRSLEAAAVIGSPFQLSLLAAALEQPIEIVRDTLAAALVERLIEEIDSASDADGAQFRFLHDRIQQAAYEQNSESARAELHQRIGDLLLERTSAPERSDDLFDIVNHLNAGTDAHSPKLAPLNFAAGQRALSASAYAPAARYLQTARQQLGASAWHDHPERMRQATELAARAAYLRADYDSMNALLEDATVHAGDVLDRIRAERIEIDALIAQNRMAEVIELGSAALSQLDIDLPAQPTEGDIGAGLARTSALLEGFDLDALVEQEPPTDAAVRLAMEMLCALAPPAYFINQALLPILGVELVRLTVEQGPTAESSYGFALLGLVLCDVGNIETGFAFGELAWALAGRFDDRRMRVRSGHVYFGFIRHWKVPSVDYLPEYHKLYEQAVDLGEFEYAAYCGMMASIGALYLTDDLTESARLARLYAEMMQETNQLNGLAVHGMVFQAMLNLIEGVDDPLTLTGEAFDEPTMVDMFRQLNDPTCLFVVHCLKSVLAGQHGQWETALEMADVARNFMHGAAATPHKVALAQWEAMAAAALARHEPDVDLREQLLARAESVLGRLELWASENPRAHGHRPVLVHAEIAGARGEYEAALTGFEAAATAARGNHRTVDEAAAMRSAGELCLDAGWTTAARSYLIEARFAFERWGASSIVRTLEHAHPSLLGNLTSRRGSGTSTSLDSATGDLDTAAVIRASHAVAKEIDLGRLVETVVRLSIEASGATHCLVISDSGDRLMISAAGVSEPSLHVDQTVRPLHGSNAGPEGVIQFVARTREELVVHDAMAEDLTSSDPYVRAHGVCSVLCLPIEQQGRLQGVLYLEHRGAAGVFTGARVALLRVLLSQAAISVENATLIRTLEEKVQARTAQLAAASEAKSVFLRSMSHELRTPLNAILGFAQVLRGDGYENDAQKEAVSTIERSGRHLLSLIEDILDLNKIEAGKAELRREPVRLQDFAEEVTQLLRQEARHKGLDLTVHTDPSLPKWIESDRTRLGQILLNLVGNAVKFTDRGAVEVNAERTGDGELRISVLDTGPGIPPERLLGIFDPFEQAGGSEQRAKGTGLGLAIARQLARQMGGSLTVASTVGEGSTFVLELPIVECDSPEEPSASGEHPVSEPADVSRAPVAIVRPSADELRRLAVLAGNGAYSALADAARELIARDDSLRPFGERLLALAREFDDDGVEALLNPS